MKKSMIARLRIRSRIPSCSRLFLTLGLLGSDSIAALHGPICSWHLDPMTTMTIQWIETRGDSSTYPGVERRWALGTAGFGYGDGDDVTALTMRDRYTSVAIRTAFDLPTTLPPDSSLDLRVLYDDGFIAYLNGKEILRENVAFGSGPDASGIRKREARRFETFTIGTVRELLKPSGNILAVEGHNADLDSSDFSLHPQLVAQPAGSKKRSEAVALVDKDTPWQYLANANPEDGWTGRMADLPPGSPGIAPGGSSVRFELEKDGGWLAFPVTPLPFADTGNTIHRVTLAGLTPGTRYRFRMTAGGSEEKVYTFATAPATLGDRFRIVTGGDMYHRRNWLDAMNGRCGALAPDVAILGGDLAYANGRDAQKWYDWVDSWAEHARAPDGRLVPMVVAIGNHEVDSKAQPAPPAKAKFFYSLFPLPEGRSNYAVDFGDYMSVILLDSGHTQQESAQTGWLRNALASRQAFPHLFVCYHRPTYGTQVKDDDPQVRTEWVPLFEEFKVDAAFENDHHVYKRTGPIFQDRVAPDKGVYYLGDGSWGVKTRSIPDLDPDEFPYMEKASSTRHLLSLDLDGREIAVEAYEASGRLLDEVTFPVRRTGRRR